MFLPSCLAKLVKQWFDNFILGQGLLGSNPAHPFYCSYMHILSCLVVCQSKLFLLLISPLCPNSVQNQFSPNNNHRLSRAKSTRIDKMILKRKIFDLLSFFKEMYGDQFGEFVTRYRG